MTRQKILFLDIDGVLIPRRVYDMPGQTKPLVTVFDPGVVGMLNTLARECGYKFVIHSSWVRSNFALHTAGNCKTVKDHMVNQGLLSEYFHEDAHCIYRFSGTRWTAIIEWLQDNPEVTRTDYWIIEDEPMPLGTQLNSARVITTDFDEGLTYRQFRQIYDGKGKTRDY